MHDSTFLDHALGLEKVITGKRLPQARRLMLWELKDNMHCSIVGTCLDRAELSTVMRRAKLRPVIGSSEYEIHAWFVCRCTEFGTIAKLAHKLLDKKYSAAIRRHMQLQTNIEILRNWEEARRNGLIAGAYWAISTDLRTDDALRRRVFGDVHMMSHFMTGRNRQDARAVHLAEERIGQLDDRLARARSQHEQAISERDARIEALERETLELRALVVKQSMPVSKPLGLCRTARSLENQGRRVAAARAMLKDARAENEQLRRQLALLTDATWQDEPKRRPAEDTWVSNGHPQFKHWLYVGGRSNAYPHLKRGAEGFCESLHFHDGGLEQSLLALDDMIAQAEVVFCPVDCVSHGACLKAKKLCRQMAKTFVPLRSASSSHFRRVASQFAREHASNASQTNPGDAQPCL